MAKRSSDLILSRVVERRGPISFREFQSLLVRLGFSLDRARGSHFIYYHPRVPRLLNIQPRGSEAKRYQLDQLRDMIREFHLLDD